MYEYIGMVSIRSRVLFKAPLSSEKLLTPDSEWINDFFFGGGGGNYKKLYTALSYLGVFPFCTCCKILICLVCIVASFKLSCE